LLIGDTNVCTGPSQSIFINYSSSIANTIGDYNKAPQGKTYMIVTLEIENKGYNKFSTNSLYWEAEVNKLKYSTSFATFSLNDKLELVDVLDGGKVKGSIAFEVPEGTSIGIVTMFAETPPVSHFWRQLYVATRSRIINCHSATPSE
jgi:hypothetical protein